MSCGARQATRHAGFPAPAFHISFIGTLSRASVVAPPDLVRLTYGARGSRLVEESGGWEAAMERLHDEVLTQQQGPGGAAPDMRAAYHCTMTLAYPDGQKVTVTDVLNGKLVWPPRGEVTQGSGFYSMFVAEGEARTRQV